MDYTQMNRQLPILSYISKHGGYFYGDDEILCADSFYFQPGEPRDADSFQKSTGDRLYKKEFFTVAGTAFMVNPYIVYPYLFAINFKPKYHPGLESNV